MDLIYEDPTVAAYEAFAPFYDSYTETYDHDRWLANIEHVAQGLGLEGKRLLDVGCGTGKSFEPMLARGYDVTACDVSPAMVERAAMRAAGTGSLVFVADARDLPLIGPFDLVTCVDDPLNYLLSDDDLARAFEGVARNLRPGGLFAFDLNTISGFRHYFAGPLVAEQEGAFFCWRPESALADVEPAATLSAVIEVFASDGGRCWERLTSRHVQRHHPPELVEELLASAGFELVACRGHVAGADWDLAGDEHSHRKLDYFARRLPTAVVKGGDAT